MTTKTLILYASVDGLTKRICTKLSNQLSQNGHTIEMVSIDKFNNDFDSYEKIIIGSSIRYGIHNKELINLIKTHNNELDSKKTAFFSVNLVARKPEKRTPDTNPYVVKFFKTIDWKPTIVEVFAGKLDYKKYSFFDRIMIQLIMWMTKGPTDKNVEIEYTNWDRVKEFGVKLSTL